MRKLLVPLSVWAFLICPHLGAQPELDKKIQAVEKNLSAEQKRLLADYIDLEVRREARYFDPSVRESPRNLPEVRKDVMAWVAAMSAEKAKVFWRDLPHTLRRGFRDLDPAHVTAQERKAAEGLPAEAKKDVAKLLHESLEDVLGARRKVLAYGPACRAMVADQLAALAHDSPKRLRHLDILAKLDFEEGHERRMRVTETALQRAAKLEKEREKPTSTIAVLVARNLCDLGGRNDPYGGLNYYNFLQKNNAYEAGVALCFGNGMGDPLGINFYGGQDNRLRNLGPVSFADVKKAPGPETTAKWWRDQDAPAPKAIAGHVYLLHLLDPRDQVDFTVKFRVIEVSSEEWIIIEWEAIPQEK